MNNQGLFPLYWRIVIRPHLKQAIVIMFLMVGSAAFDAITIGLTVPLFDLVTNPGQPPKNRLFSTLANVLERLGLPSDSNGVIFALLVFVCALFVVQSLFSLLHKYWTALIAHKLRREMKTSLFQRIMVARYEDVTQRARGIWVNDIHNAADSIYLAIIGLGHLFTGIFNTILMIGLMLYLSWWTTLLIGALALGGVLNWRRFADRKAAALGKETYDLRSSQAKLEVDAIDGLKVIKSHAIEDRMVERENTLVYAEKKPTAWLVLLRQGPTLINELVATLIVLIFGTVTFLFPVAGIRFSMLVAFLLAVRRVAPALADINASSVELNRGRCGIEVVEEVFNRLPQEKRGGRDLKRVEEIRLVALSFAYASRPDRTILDGVHVTMRRGNVTALVGPTGSGKTTVAHLLVSLYAPRSGSILVNGIDLRELDLESWRRKVGYVAQDVFVFNTSILKNITLGDSVSNSKVEWAAGVAQLHDFISGLPQGYETVVGDRGLRLSGGQCQRLNIARAILRHPDVLIFDEATSALDNLTERAVYDAINAMRQDALVIVIAHRLSTVKDADQIIVLESGRIVESGTHESLMKRQGVYTGLYEESNAEKVRVT